MKFVYLILFLSFFAASEVVMEFIGFDDEYSSACDSPMDDQPDGENEDSSESEDDQNDELFFSYSSMNEIVDNTLSQPFVKGYQMRRHPFLEICGLPPEV